MKNRPARDGSQATAIRSGSLLPMSRAVFSTTNRDIVAAPIWERVLCRPPVIVENMQRTASKWQRRPSLRKAE